MISCMYFKSKHIIHFIFYALSKLFYRRLGIVIKSLNINDIMTGMD